MMTNTKWLRRALLGGVALSVMATGAQADELTDLKSQLEALQSRVNQLEQQPQARQLPEGTSFLTLSRGSADIRTHVDRSHRLRDEMPVDRGFTIAVTPTADFPAPVSEVVVYGFVKGDVIFDFDHDTGDGFSPPALLSAASDDDDVHLRMHARQTRFGIRSRHDTAIGQIRTQVEGDFFAGPSSEVSVSSLFRQRHTFGEWDMTPNWTLLIGQTTRTAVLVPIGVATVDFFSSAGTGGFPRAMQVRLTYHSGPISWAVAAEKPSAAYTDTAWPDLAAYVQYDIPGGHEFIVTGAIADGNGTHTFNPFFDVDKNGVFFEPIGDERVFGTSLTLESDRDISWVVGAGANINLADIATLTVGAHYGEGTTACEYLNQDTGCGAADPFHVGALGIAGGNTFFGTDRAFGLTAGLSFNVTETTSFNVQYGFVRTDNEFGGDIEAHIFDETDVELSMVDHIDTHTVHANILWQPVAQMRLGWEVMWGRVESSGASGEFTFEGEDFELRDVSEDAIRAQFGAWFFF